MSFDILDQIAKDKDKYQVGKSKVFLRAGQVGLGLVISWTGCFWKETKKNTPIAGLL